jgi:hypothetical protein
MSRDCGRHSNKLGSLNLSVNELGSLNVSVTTDSVTSLKISSMLTIMLGTYLAVKNENKPLSSKGTQSAET